jgi:predicted transcriptional regulator
MPTTVHLPKPLLDAVDRKARALRISRNALVMRALERELREAADWSPGFFERLSRVDDDTSQAVDDLLRAVRNARCRPST